MTWEEKLMALQSLGSARITLHSIGKWQVSISGIEIRTPGGMLSSTFGAGADIESAVMQLWDELSNLTSGKYVVINAMSPKRRAVKWSGFMWSDISEPNLIAST